MRIAVVLIFCIFVGANSFLLQQSRQSIPAAASLSGLKGFPSQVGENFGYDKLNTLLNLINSAAQFYRDDLEKNLHYIQTNMQAAYGVGNVSINVIIQVNSTESITSTFIYRCFYCFASLPTGVSTINPTWSYFAYIIDRHDNWITEYVPHIGQGSGINTGTVNAIKNIIFKRDGNRKCTCRQTLMIQMDLNLYDSQYWNVVCHSQPISEGYVNVRDKQWISAKPYSCYYMLYAL